jgi:hypothetical protein
MDEVGPQMEDTQVRHGWARVRELLVDVAGGLLTLGLILWQGGWLPDVDVMGTARRLVQQAPQTLARLADEAPPAPRLAELERALVVHLPHLPEPLAELPARPHAPRPPAPPSHAHPLSVAAAVRACDRELLAEGVEAVVESDGHRALQERHRALLAGLEGRARREAAACLSAMRSAASRIEQARRTAERLLEQEG